MEILFIRHAESEANAGMKTSDPATISLTQTGKLSAIKLADRINLKPELIIVTPYLRTLQTAEPFILKYPHVPVETWPLQEFTYLSPSACHNTTAKDRLPMTQQYWSRCDPEFVHGVGAESFIQFSTRVSECLEVLAKLKSDNILVFTHSQVIQMIRQLMSLGNLRPSDAMLYFMKNSAKHLIKNAEVVKISFR